MHLLTLLMKLFIFLTTFTAALLNLIFLQGVFDSLLTCWPLIFSQSSFSGEIQLMKNFECSVLLSFAFISLALKIPYKWPCLDWAVSSYNFQRYLGVNINGHLRTDLQKCIKQPKSMSESLMSVELTFDCVPELFMPLSVQLSAEERDAEDSILSETALS